MAAYIALVGIPIFFQLFLSKRIETKHKGRKVSVTLVVFFLLLFILLSCRSVKVGVDLENYIPWFQRISKTPWKEIFTVVEGIEPGYIVLNKLISIFSDNPQFFLTVIALITVFPLAILYGKNSENELLTIALFLILSNFNMLFSGLRQAIAISVGAVSYYFVKRKKFFLFLCSVIFAMLFHKSAFMLFLLYPVYHVRITKRWLWWIVPALVGIFIFNKQIFSLLIGFLGEKYQEQYNVIESTGAYAMIFLFVLFAIYSFLVPDTKKLDKETIGLRNILLLSICIQLFAPINTVAMRMNYYFLTFLPLLIPKVGSRCKTVDIKIVSLANTVMIIFFIAYFLLNTFIGEDILQIYPYIPFWKG